MLPTTADVVVIGGGVMGASAAYHLAARGIKNVVLLEKAPFLGMEATGKCAGGIRYQFSTEINVRLSLLSLPMLERFEEELGQAIDLRWPGYLFLLDNEHDLAVFRNNVALQNRLGIPSRILAPAEVAARVPLLNLEGIIAAGWHDRDGLADPNGVVQGYAAGARRLGAQIFTEVEATGIRVESGRVAAVETPAGTIATRAVVNAAGPWAGKVAALAGVDLPIVPLRRQIVVTTPLQGHPRGFPVRARLQPLALLPPRGQRHPDRPVQPATRRRASTRPSTTAGPSSTWSGPCGASRCWSAPACCANGPGCTR